MVSGLETDGTLPAANLPVRGDCHTADQGVTDEGETISLMRERPERSKVPMRGWAVVKS